MKGVPEPRGSMATRGMRSRRRMSSLCQAAACPSSQWLHLTVMAGCRCVKPGISTSTSCSARATDARSKSAREPLMSFSLFISQSLVSVATCSGHCLFIALWCCTLQAGAVTVIMHQFCEVQAANQGERAEYRMHVSFCSGSYLSGTWWGIQNCSLHRQALSINVCTHAHVLSYDWT